MKLLVFYKQNSEHTRRVEEYLRDLMRMRDIKESDIKIVDPNTRSGATDASLYDIWEFPAFVVISGTGQYVNSWSGDLPLMNDLMSYIFTLQ